MSPWQFYWEWIKRTFKWPLSWTSLLALILTIIGGFVGHVWPQLSDRVTFLLWAIPGVVLVLFVIIGFFIAPYSIAKEMAGASDLVLADRALFEAFQKELPFEGSIRFLRDHDLWLAFDLARLFDLEHFAIRWTDAAHKFHDPKLERAKRLLRDMADQFRWAVAKNTFPRLPDRQLQEIPPEWYTEQPERYKEVYEMLSRMADEIVAAHQRFVELARKRLRV